MQADTGCSTGSYAFTGPYIPGGVYTWYNRYGGYMPATHLYEIGAGLQNWDSSANNCGSLALPLRSRPLLRPPQGRATRS
jgi:hypothetical protein